jgi:hypothetical protein
MNALKYPSSIAPQPPRPETGLPLKWLTVLAGGAALLVASAFIARADTKFYSGVVMIQYYDNITGTTISDLRSSPKFPNSPDRVVFASSPEIPVDAGNNYGTRITGVFIPHQNEAYHLIICSDDQSELYLSSDASPAHNVLIAREPQWNGSRAWAIPDRRLPADNVDPNQPAPNVSVPQTFTANQQRYFEMLMKEGGGGDNLALTTVIEGFPVPPDGTAPDLGGFDLGVFADDVPKVLSGPKLKNGSAVAGQETTLTAVYYQPPGTTTYQWFRNGVAIGGATDAEYTFTPAAADAGATYRTQVTVDGKTGSAEVVLRFDAFSPGLAKLEYFNDIGGGTAVQNLLDSAKYQANTPDEIRFIAGASIPTDVADNYGARLSFSFVPAAAGDYRFFTRSDDASRIYLSTDGTLNDTTATVLAEETACCGTFMDPPAPETSEPQALKAGTRYLIFGLMKEGGGGDFLQIAAREETDTTPAPSLHPIAGALMGVMANGTGVGLTIAQQPQSAIIVEERDVTFETRGVATPDGTPVVYQWQKNGVDIPGANSSRLILTAVPLSANNTTYKAIIGTVGGIQQTTSVATLTVLIDTFPPQPRSNVRRRI